MTATDTTVTRVFASDEDLLPRVLTPYKDHCRYLLTAEVSALPGGLSRVRSTFAIAESCYIDDTGHLNAVEVNIAYNQMMYYLVAKSVKEGLLAPPAPRHPHRALRLTLPTAHPSTGVPRRDGVPLRRTALARR